MATLAVLSDMHGNLPSLEAVLSDLKNFEIDHVIVPGDVISAPPFSRKTAECGIANH